MALLRAIPVVDALIKTLEGDEKIGAHIVRRSLEEPLRMIVKNAGAEGAVVVAKSSHPKIRIMDTMRQRAHSRILSKPASSIQRG